MSQIKNTLVYNAKDLHAIIWTCNLLDCSDYYSKTSASLWQYCRCESVLDDNDDMINFNGDNIIDPIKFKAKITGRTSVSNNKHIDIAVL